jgi:hypothetical protein
MQLRNHVYCFDMDEFLVINFLTHAVVPNLLHAYGLWLTLPEGHTSHVLGWDCAQLEQYFNVLSVVKWRHQMWEEAIQVDPIFR